MGEWQPIETAPRNGTAILGCNPTAGTGTMLVRWAAACDFLTEAEIDILVAEGADPKSFETEDWFAADFATGCRLQPDCHPTLWQPLPEPPK